MFHNPELVKQMFEYKKVNSILTRILIFLE